MSGKNRRGKRHMLKSIKGFRGTSEAENFSKGIEQRVNGAEIFSFGAKALPAPQPAKMAV